MSFPGFRPELQMFNPCGIFWIIVNFSFLILHFGRINLPFIPSPKPRRGEIAVFQYFRFFSFQLSSLLRQLTDTPDKQLFNSFLPLFSDNRSSRKVFYFLLLTVHGLPVFAFTAFSFYGQAVYGSRFTVYE